KVSLGAENTVEWEKHARTHILLDDLKKKGYKIFAVEQHKTSVPYYKIKLSGKEKDGVALVFGHEIKGLSPAILKRADKILEIPMAGKKESLNVSVTFGIVIFSMIYN
ncbi:MAG: TrmH family RNA methyltransferase, partial [Candidatus Spechtbacteria bacterium]|nr:TrmH family RNA methyltransferase [Candidatus Spechtbacteria bacterium]